MMEWITDHPVVAWFGLAVALALAELFSLDFVLLMFALGAVAASLATLLGVPLWAAVGTFVAVATILLVVARPPIVARLHAGPTLSHGFQNLVGKSALVLSPVDSRDGRVRIDAEEWSARTEGERIDVGVETRVVRIDGATAVVSVPDSIGEF